MTQATLKNNAPRKRNTNKGKPSVFRSRNWGPNTWNNYTEGDYTALNYKLKRNTEEYYINKEVGKKEMTPHLQFCMRYKNAKTFNSMKKRYPKCHLEISHNWFATRNYCQKIETKVEPKPMKYYYTQEEANEVCKDFNKWLDQHYPLNQTCFIKGCHTTH